MTIPPTPTEADMEASAQRLSQLRDNLKAVIFGQDEVVEQVLVALLARGHVLLEGLPGLGKTQLARALADSIAVGVNRIQFTPDLLPTDITGSSILQEVEGKRQFEFQEGPLFSNLILADEINRASPKTQSALLEAMQERQVTVSGKARLLPTPFFVIATQNPIELEGTYPLPEAQLDRFLFKIEVGTNPPEVLERIIEGHRLGVNPTVKEVMSASALVECCELAGGVYLPGVVVNFIARLVHATHPQKGTITEGKVKYGASPRAALALAASARAKALLARRMHASIEDVRAVAAPVLRHRLLLDYTARLEGKTADHIIAALLDTIPSSVVSPPKTLRDVRI